MSGRDLQARSCRKKAQKFSVLPTKIARAPIGASEPAIALRSFAPLCGQPGLGILVRVEGCSAIRVAGHAKELYE